MITSLAPATGPRRLGLLTLLALLHLSVWWGLDGLWRPNKPLPDASQRVELRLLRLLQERKMPTRVETPQPRPPFKTRSVTAAPSRTITPAAEPVAPQDPSSEPAPEPPSNAPATEKLLNSEATRRALHQATRAPLLSERAATAMGDGPPLAQSEKLGQEIKKHGNGDCLKGEFLGAGAGILSLPFWLLAEARGKCAR